MIKCNWRENKDKAQAEKNAELVWSVILSCITFLAVTVGIISLIKIK